MTKHSVKYSQVFLQDQLILKEMSASCGRFIGNHKIIEIGPGHGAFTQHLLSYKQPLHAIEIDPSCCEVLASKFGAQVDFCLYNQDILKFNLPSILRSSDEKVVVIGNIPYHISTAIILMLIDTMHSIQHASLLVQEEYGLRLLAKPKTKAYGRITILTQLLFDIESSISVPATAFTPIPKVNSLFLQLTPKSNQLHKAQIKKLKKITALFFQHRRKKLRSVSKYSEVQLPADILECRAEELSPEQYKQLLT